MKPALKKKWVDALLSGEYKQGKGVLQKSGRFCCLGVLRHANDPLDYRGSSAWLDGTQNREFGLTDRVQHELATVNDCGVPFDMIAGLIDEAL